MSAIPRCPSVAQIADHFIGAVRQSERADRPFRHWKLRDVFPEALCTAILVLPIAPPMLGHTDGTRGSYNQPAHLHHAGAADRSSRSARRWRMRCSVPTWRG